MVWTIATFTSVNTVPAVTTAKTDSQPTYQSPSDRSLGFGCHGGTYVTLNVTVRAPILVCLGISTKRRNTATAVPGSMPTLGTRHWIPELAIGGMFTLLMGTFPFLAESIFLAYDCLMY